MKKYIFKSGISFLLLLMSFGVFSQEISPSDLWLDPADNDFATIQSNVEQYYANRDKGQGSGYKKWKRWEYYNQNRLTPDGKITNIAARSWETYLEQQERMANMDAGDNLMVTNGSWTSIGPFMYTLGTGWNPGNGRLNVIAFHPTNSNIFWVGAPAGGLWKTMNGGTSWSPQTDGMPRIGVSGIAIDYTNTNTMYILTGDGDGGDTKSIGVLKTINNGMTWLSTGLSWTVADEVTGFKLLMHPTNANVLFAVTTLGIYRTINAGFSWTQVLAGSFRDIEFKPGDPTVVYVSGTSSFYKSADTGGTWSAITAGVPTGCNRIALGVSPANPTYVYLFAGPATGTGAYKGFYLSTNSGDNFSVRSTTPNILGYSSTGNDAKQQSYYDLAVAVSTTNSANVIAGGINTWTSANWGSSWTISSMWSDPGGTIGYTHADIHDLSINSLDNYLYCCSDGGIFRSTDFGLNWTNLTYGIANTEWYRIAGTATNSNLIIGGAQDNGSNKWTGGLTMEHIYGADGMDCMIDHANSNIMYYTAQYGELAKSTNGGTSYINVTPSGLTGPWVTPLVMNPSNSSIIYGGYPSVYKSTNGGSTWTNMGSSGGSALAISANSPDRIYAANGTSMSRTDNGGFAWINISAGLPGIGITFIGVNPDNSLDVFVTVGGYNAGQKVYASSNGGTSWTNISGTLPNVIVNCIAYEDNNAAPDDALYIGTDLGVYYRNASIGDWIFFQNGLPNVPVSDLEINKAAGVIRAATYGRGLWSSSLYSACPADYLLTTSNNPGNPNYTGFQFYEASNSITSSREITGGIGTDVTYKAGNFVKLTTGFNAKENNFFMAILGPCQAIANILPGSYERTSFK